MENFKTKITGFNLLIKKLTYISQLFKFMTNLQIKSFNENGFFLNL